MVFFYRSSRCLSLLRSPLPVDGIRRPADGATPAGLRLCRSLPRSIPRAWFPVPSSPFPVPRSPFPVPSSQFPVPSSRRTKNQEPRTKNQEPRTFNQQRLPRSPTPSSYWLKNSALKALAVFRAVRAISLSEFSPGYRYSTAYATSS